MKAQVVVVVLAAAAFTQAQRCKEARSWSDGCNKCMCIPNEYPICTMMACPPPDLQLVTWKKAWCEDRGDGGWLDDCHWCTCSEEEGELYHVCTRKNSCFTGEEEFPDCSGNVSWMRDCNRCRCSSTGLALCTKKACRH